MSSLLRAAKWQRIKQGPLHSEMLVTS